MARNGSGTYNRAVAPYVAGTTITAGTVNSEMDDMAAALTQSLSRDGQSPPTANLPMGGFRITGLANAIASTDAAPLGQVVAKAGDTMTGGLGVVAGTAAAPGVFVAGDANTGFFQAAAAPDTLSVSVGGVEVGRYGAGGFMRLAAGTAAAPAYSFSGDDNTGFMNPTADVIGIVTAGALRGTVDSVGNVVFGASTNNVQDQVGAARPLLIQSGSNNTTLGASTNALVVANSDTTANNSSQLNFAAITGASPNQYTSAIIAAIHGARTNGQYHAGALAFLVAPGANVAPTERMRVPATGPISLTGDLDVAGNLRFNSGYGSAALAYGVRAWVNFNGTGTVAIRGSGGVTSITDNGTGDYTVNLNFTMPDANYAPNINVSESGVAGGSATEAASIVSLATTSFRFACKYSYSIFSGGATSNRFDPSIVSASVVR